MAKFNVYSIKDTVENEYDKQLFLGRNDTRVLFNMRSSMEQALKRASDAGQPKPFELEDFVLYKVGIFDTETGLIEPVELERIRG